jgi:hypothetical protein
LCKNVTAAAARLARKFAECGGVSAANFCKWRAFLKDAAKAKRVLQICFTLQVQP